MDKVIDRQQHGEAATASSPAEQQAQNPLNRRRTSAADASSASASSGETTQPATVHVDNVLLTVLSRHSGSAINTHSAAGSLAGPVKQAIPAQPKQAGGNLRQSQAHQETTGAGHMKLPVKVAMSGARTDGKHGATASPAGIAISRRRAKPRRPTRIVEREQWLYFVLFFVKALLVAGVIGLVVYNCAYGAPDSKRQAIPSQNISIAGQTCQIDPEINGWWVTLVGVGVAQLVYAAGVGMHYVVTDWFPRNSSEVYLLQLPVSTVFILSVGAGLAGGGFLLLVLSWFVVSLVSGFAVVFGLMTRVPGLSQPAARGKTTGNPRGTKQIQGTDGGALSSSGSGANKSTAELTHMPAHGAEKDEFAHANPQRAGPVSGRAKQQKSAKKTSGAAWGICDLCKLCPFGSAAGAGDEVDNPYSVTVQQYGRFYTALLLLYEFNKISDIATALILGVGDPLRVSFFVLGTLSLVHVQVTFYWLVGTRDGDTTVLDLYRGFGDVVLDTPMLCIEFYAIVTGIITETNFTVLALSIATKTLCLLSHVFTLYKDIHHRGAAQSAGSGGRNASTSTGKLPEAGAKASLAIYKAAPARTGPNKPLA